MSAEYRDRLLSELKGTASNWWSWFKLLSTLGSYASAALLRYRQAPDWQVAGALIVGVVVTFFWLYVSAQAAWEKENDERLKAEAERDKLLDDLKPKFKIVFEPEDHEDSRPWVQTMRFERTTGSRLTERARSYVDRRYRVGVVNLGTQTIRNVSLTLESCTPPANFIHINFKLLVMDSKPPSGEGDLIPSAEGKATLWFDVVNELAREPKEAGKFSFCYANPELECEVSFGDYEIVLRADGANVSTRKRFRIKKPASQEHDDWRVMMTAL